ncbi:DUF305 domain-containing protein [Streptomyces sp. SGAir0957]
MSHTIMSHTVMSKNLIRRSALGAVAGATALVLAACGSGDDTPASPAQHNTADVAFATGMIPHHRQAVEMAGLAPSRAGSAEVKKVASEIEKAQAPEIRTLSGWLTSWGERVPSAGAMNHSTHDMNDMNDMNGMMTAADMGSLKSASGEKFDTAFLKMMIEHHKGAVAMAKTEKAEGAYPGAQKMADSVITSQSAEISLMTGLLGKS